MNILDVTVGIAVGVGMTKLYERFAPNIHRTFNTVLTKIKKCREPTKDGNIPIRPNSSNYMVLGLDYKYMRKDSTCLNEKY
jgi:hypothetical protein